MFSQIILFFKATNVLGLFQVPPTFFWPLDPKKLDWVLQARVFSHQPFADTAYRLKFIEDIHAFVNNFLD